MADYRTHLGDGAYARPDGWYLWVEADRGCTRCGYSITHQVALEPSAIIALVEVALKAEPDLAEHITRAVARSDQNS